jgi:hypothetical protein
LVGDTVDVWIRGENVGGAPADSVVPDLVPPGNGSVIAVAGPDPIYADLAGGGDTVFRCTYIAADTASVRWSGQLSGTDQTSGLPIESSQGMSNIIVILPRSFLRADANGDREVAMSDAVFLLEWLFLPDGDDPPCMKAADSDDDGALTMADAIYTLRYLYIPGSPEPPAPFPDCNVDLTDDSLRCNDHPCFEMMGRARQRGKRSNP